MVRNPSRKPSNIKTSDIANWEETADYIIFKEGTTYIAVNGNTGAETRNSAIKNLLDIVVPALASNGIIFFKPGTYAVVSRMNYSAYDGIRYIGSGCEATIWDVPSTTQNLIDLGDHCSIEHLKVDGDANLQTQIVMGDYCTLNDLYIDGGGGYGAVKCEKHHCRFTNLRFENIKNTSNGWANCIGMSENTCHDNLVENIWVKTCDRAIEIEDNAYQILVNRVFAEACTDTSVATIAVHHHTTKYPHDIVVSNCILKDTHSISCSSESYNVVFSDCIITEPIDSIDFSNDYCTVIGCIFDLSTIGAVPGIRLYNGANFINNTIYNGKGTHCLQCLSGNSLIMGNDIQAAAASPATYGIRLDCSTATDVTRVIGNHIHGVWGSYSLFVDDAIAIITNNHVEDDGVYVDDGATGYVYNNIFHSYAEHPSAISTVRGNVGLVTEAGGAAANIADGGTIAHGLAGTPTYAILIGSVAGDLISISALGAANITVNIKDEGGGAGTAQTIYWRAYYIR